MLEAVGSSTCKIFELPEARVFHSREMLDRVDEYESHAIVHPLRSWML